MADVRHTSSHAVLAVGWACRRWGREVWECCSSVQVGEDAVQVVVREGVRGVDGEGRG